MKAPRRVPALLRVTVRFLEPRFRRAYGDEVRDLIEETWARDIAPLPAPKRQIMTVRLLVDTIRRGLSQRMGQPRAAAPAWESTYQDLRHAMRAVRHHPGGAVIVAATLGIGSGAVATVLGAMDAEMRRALPYPDADRLVVVQESYRGSMRNASLPNLEDWKSQASAFQAMTGFDDRKLFTITGRIEPQRVYGAAVDGNFFSVLRLDPVVGRLIGATDDRPEAPRVVVLSERLWRRVFSADSALIGAIVVMNQLPYTVIGVAPEYLRIPDEEELWVPLQTHPFGDDRLVGRRARILEVVARLQPGATLQNAQTEMHTIASRLQAEHPDANAEWGAAVVPLRETVVGQRRPAVLLAALLGVCTLLVLTCVNVTNLLLVRTLRRRQELGIRVAMGAGRMRLAKQLLLESTLVGVGGGVFAVGVTIWGHRALVRLLPEWFPILSMHGVSPTVLALSGVGAVLAGLIAGTVPAWFAVKAAPTAAVSADTQRAGDSRGVHRLRGALVVVEVATALTLVIGAGLLLRSFERLSRVPVGFDPSQVLTALVDLPPAQYPVGEQTASFYENLLDGLEGHPMVQAAAAASRLPLASSTSIVGLEIEGRPETAEEPRSAHVRLVTTGLFETLGIPVLRGRAFTEEDRAAQTAIVDHEVASIHFGGADPIGKRVRVQDTEYWYTIVGVVGATRHWGAEYDATPTIFFPHRAQPQGAMTVALKTAGDPRLVATTLRQAVRATDPDLALSQIQTLREYVDQSMATPRFNAVLFTLFAGFAVLLAALGLYGLIAFGVAQRTREIGVRVALGARSADVARMVVSQAVGITFLGTIIGLVGAIVGGRVLEALLFEISARDVLTFVLAPVLLLAIAFVASAIPARRAARLDPVTALRGR